MVLGWKSCGLYHQGCTQCCQDQAEPVHSEHQDPRVQDGVVLHGHHGGPHCHSQAEETGHGKTAENS